MTGYVYTKHPITGETIVVLPTGKTDGGKAEFMVLSPRSNLTTLWLERKDIFGKEHVGDNPRDKH